VSRGGLLIICNTTKLTNFGSLFVYSRVTSGQIRLRGQGRCGLSTLIHTTIGFGLAGLDKYLLIMAININCRVEFEFRAQFKFRIQNKTVFALNS